MANKQNLKPNTERTPEERVELARKAGKASGRKRKERKSIADALRKVLDEPLAKGSRMTRLDGISAKALKQMFDNPRMKDIKILAEILGELTQNIKAEGMTIIVQSPEEKEKLDSMGNLEI